MTKYKFLKVSKSSCTPCMRIQLFLDNNATDKHYAIKDINSLDDITEDNILYCSTIESNPEIAAHFELSGVPAIIKLNDKNEVEDVNKDIVYGFNIEHLNEVVSQIG